MNRNLHTLALATVLAASALAAQAQSLGAPNAQPSAELNAQARRITDTRIAKDYQGYQAQQAAIKALNDTGKHAVASYSLAKAQCWLDVSFHEYTRNDRSAFPQDALTESFRITQFLASGAVIEPPAGINGTSGSNGTLIAANANPAGQTLLINNGQRLRSDLWDQAQALKGQTAYGGPTYCAERQVACAEVELAHAGNEINQQGWRHARPYIQLAEDYIASAKSAIAQCAPAPVIKAPIVIAAPVAPPPPPAPAVILPPIQLPPLPQAVNLGAEVLFNFDKRDMPNVRDYTKARLDALIAQVKTGGFKVNAINLTGHADRSNNTGNNNYNTQLAMDRANLIKNYMVGQGIAANLISVDAKSDSQQVEACSAKPKSKKDFEECLLPNRRVVVTVTGVK
jgi:OmpA-OmpF porin, OOP family